MGKDSSKTKRTFLGLKIYFGKNTQDALDREHKLIQDRKLSYEEVGATKLALPKGYTIDRYSLILGKGSEIFNKSIKGYKDGVSHRGAGLTITPKDFQFIEGASALFSMKIGPFTLVFPDRIVYMSQTENEFKCAYGTIEGHPESGEELFSITLKENEDVVFEIICFSKIVAPLARLGYPVSRFLQKRMTNIYLMSLKDYVNTK